jgi:hypothetical protein
MKRVSILLTAAVLSLTSIAMAGQAPGCCPRKPASPVNARAVTAGDPGRDARFRMKYGRSMPGSEQQSKPTVESAKQAACEHDCCKHSA